MLNSIHNQLSLSPTDSKLKWNRSKCQGCLRREASWFSNMSTWEELNESQINWFYFHYFQCEYEVNVGFCNDCWKACTDVPNMVKKFSSCNSVTSSFTLNSCIEKIFCLIFSENCTKNCKNCTRYFAQNAIRCISVDRVERWMRVFVSTTSHIMRGYLENQLWLTICLKMAMNWWDSDC